MLKQLWRTNAPLTFTGLLMLPALAIAIAGLLIDPRIITDAPAWLKPAKFAVSIAIYVFTLAWAFTLIPGWRKTRRVVGWATAIAMVLEFAIIALQAYRGTTSHFNFSTPSQWCSVRHHGRGHRGADLHQHSRGCSILAAEV